MSAVVTREEFDRLEGSVMDILKEIKTLNETLGKLVTAIEVNNTSTCKDVATINEKLNSLQESRSEMWKIINELKIKVYIAWSIPPIIFGFLELYRHFKP